MRARDHQGQTLFTDPEAQPAPSVATVAILADLRDSAAILAMGEEGIGAATLERLRSEILEAAAQLERRWAAETPA